MLPGGEGMLGLWLALPTQHPPALRPVLALKLRVQVELPGGLPGVSRFLASSTLWLSCVCVNSC